MKNKAKRFPIEKIYPGQLKKSGNCLVGRCPLHDDTKPSFAIYPDTNSWYCFTEGIGGDVIDLLMKLYKIDFSEAVERLSYGT